MQGSQYNLEDFMKACIQIPGPSELGFHPDIVDDAYKFFKIKNREDLLEFIGNNEFEWIRHYKTTAHEKNPSILIDAYLFSIDNVEGYLAFLKKSNNTWFLKSFHLSNIKVGDVTKSVQMKDTLKYLRKIGLI